MKNINYSCRICTFVIDDGGIRQCILKNIEFSYLVFIALSLSFSLSLSLFLSFLILNNEKCGTVWSTSVHLNSIVTCRTDTVLDELSLTCRKFFPTRSRTFIVSQGAIRHGYCRLSNLPVAISPISSEFEHYLRRTSVRSPESNELDELRERRSVEGNTREIDPIQFSYSPQESSRI